MSKQPFLWKVLLVLLVVDLDDLVIIQWKDDSTSCIPASDVEKDRGLLSILGLTEEAWGASGNFGGVNHSWVVSAIPFFMCHDWCGVRGDAIDADLEEGKSSSLNLLNSAAVLVPSAVLDAVVVWADENGSEYVPPSKIWQTVLFCEAPLRW